MHMRTELALVVAAVLRHRSGTWTPMLKPAVRAACGRERESRAFPDGRPLASALSADLRNLPGEKVTDIWRAVCSRKCNAERPTAPQKGCREVLHSRFRPMLGARQNKFGVTKERPTGQPKTFVVSLRSVHLHMEAAKRLKCGRQPADRSRPNLRSPSCRRRHPSLAPLRAPDDPASPATTTSCSRPTTTRQWGDEPTGITHHGHLRFRACGSLRPRRAVPATASASQARPRSHSRRSCAQQAASSTRLLSGWACSASRAACSSTRTSSGLTSSRPGAARVTSGARSRPRRARPRRTRRRTSRPSPRHATMRTAVGRASTGAPARSYCSSYCSSLRTPLASRSTTTRWSRHAPNASLL